MLVSYTLFSFIPLHILFFLYVSRFCTFFSGRTLVDFATQLGSTVLHATDERVVGMKLAVTRNECGVMRVGQNGGCVGVDQVVKDYIWGMSGAASSGMPASGAWTPGAAPPPGCLALLAETTSSTLSSNEADSIAVLSV